jgi:hypothetical protein
MAGNSTKLTIANFRSRTRIEVTAAGTDAWTDHVIAASEGLLFTKVDSWMTGINRNVKGSRPAGSCATAAATPPFASAAKRWWRTSIASWRWLRAAAAGAATLPSDACLRSHWPPPSSTIECVIRPRLPGY